jgi:hypothetical protein
MAARRNTENKICDETRGLFEGSLRLHHKAWRGGDFASLCRAHHGR